MDDLYTAYQLWYTAYQLCTCGDVCQGCTVCDSFTYQHQPCVKRQWLQHLPGVPITASNPRTTMTFEEKVDRFIDALQENDFVLVPWQVNMIRNILLRGHERS